MRMAQKDFESGLWTAMPAFVHSYSATALTVEAQPTIQGQVRQPDGSWLTTTMPLCVDCPVLFPGGGGFVTTFPLAAKDEGLLIFASRCIDSWWQSGGIQTQAELRMHDLSDGFFLPVCFSQPNVPSSVSTTAVEMRSKDGKTLFHIETGKIVASLNSGATLLTVDNTNNAITASLGSGATILKVDGAAQKVNITATNGLWVNGVMVNVP